MHTPLTRLEPARTPQHVPSLRLALLLTSTLTLALPAGAQSPTGNPNPSSSPSSTSSSSGRSSAPAARSNRAAEEERDMVEDLAHAHLAEVETGRLALEKTQNTQVRSFAQQMVDDHTKAYQELQQLGQGQQLTVPSETDFQHKAIATAMRLLSGETFDKQYIRQVGINDHRRSVDLLMKMQQTSRNPQLKALAGRQLPIVERHLAMARELDQTMR